MQDIKGLLRILDDGFIWQIIDSENAEGYIGSVFELLDDGSEAFVEHEDELTPGGLYGIEMGFVNTNTCKRILKTHGNFVDNLWRIDDVMDKYQVTEEEAQYILDKALTNDATMEQIWFAIDEFAELEGHEPQKEE